MVKYYYVFLTLFLGCVFSSSAQVQQKASSHYMVINQYLQDNKLKLNFKDRDIERILVSDEYIASQTGLTHIYLQQTYNGIVIDKAISSMAIKDRKVFYFSNNFYQNIEDKIIATTTPLITAYTAIFNAVEILNLGSLQNLELLSQQENIYNFSKGGVSNRNIPVKLVFTKVEDRILLSWDITILKNDLSNWYNIKIDALTGDLLVVDDFMKKSSLVGSPHTHDHKHNLQQHQTKRRMLASIAERIAKEAGQSPHTHDLEYNYLQLHQTKRSMVSSDGASYNVFAIPTESPNHGARQIVTNPSSTLASPFGWHDIDGVVGADFTYTAGNNVVAKENRDATSPFNLLNFDSDNTAEGTSSLTFDFPLDLNQPHPNYGDASITNLFYVNNMLHDIWYHHGFDEVSGNFQFNNYGNGGLGNDPILAITQDGNSLNNAFFMPAPDGSASLMGMFMFEPDLLGNTASLIIQNSSISGSYSGIPAAFGANIPTSPLTSSLILAEDDTPDIYDICNPIVNGSSLIGNIAVLRRGSCEFGAKILAVENEGAVAAIVVNNTTFQNPFIMAPASFGNQVTIPSIMVSQADGEAIINALINGESITASLVNNNNNDPNAVLIDSSFDTGVIAHEYGHGISDRLVGGPSINNCLLNDEQMGEGWSDWIGLMVTMKASDTAADARGSGTFVLNQPVTGIGIRPRQYSTDFTINELTYNATNNPTLSVPHGVGSVWATMLWDLTWAYIDKYGFDSDLFNGNGGNNKVMKLVIDGLRLLPCEPGFIDGRDTLLAADMATTGGVDQCMIWQVFANRGLGFNASQGSPDSRFDQTEDFSMPPSNDPSLVNCSSLSIDNFNEDLVSVYPNPIDNKIFINTKQNLGEAKISLVDLSGRIILKTTQEISNNSIINVETLQKGIYILNISSESFSFVKKIIKK